MASHSQPLQRGIWKYQVKLKVLIIYKPRNSISVYIRLQKFSHVYKEKCKAVNFNVTHNNRNLEMASMPINRKTEAGLVGGQKVWTVGGHTDTLRETVGNTAEIRGQTTNRAPSDVNCLCDDSSPNCHLLFETWKVFWLAMRESWGPFTLPRKPTPSWQSKSPRKVGGLVGRGCWLDVSLWNC